MKRLWLVYLTAIIVACSDSSGAGGAGGARDGGNPAWGGAPEGGFPAATCYLAPDCVAPDEPSCTCNGCDERGCYDPSATPPILSDCSCPICAGEVSCSKCDDDEKCDPFFETCFCVDCAGLGAGICE